MGLILATGCRIAGVPFMGTKLLVGSTVLISHRNISAKLVAGADYLLLEFRR